MPEVEVYFLEKLNELTAKVEDIKNHVFYPVPFSELEEVKEWTKSWDELGYLEGYVLTSGTVKIIENRKDNTFLESVYFSKHQAESALAFAQLSQLHAAMVGDWVPDWKDGRQDKFIENLDSDYESVAENIEDGVLFIDFNFIEGAEYILNQLNTEL